MSSPSPERQLAQARHTRMALKARVERGMAQAKADLAASGVGARIAARGKAEAREIANQVGDIARDSKGIIAVTAVALGAWMMRGQLLKAVRTLAARRLGGGDQA